jgi:hypothetical protein
MLARKIYVLKQIGDKRTKERGRSFFCLGSGVVNEIVVVAA